MKYNELVSVIHIGSNVRIAVDNPIYDFGSVKKGSIGTITSIDNNECTIDFPEQEDWIGLIIELEIMDDCISKDDIEVGTIVQATNATLEWGNVKHGDHGVVINNKDSEYVIEFMTQKSWYATYSDLEIVKDQQKYKFPNVIMVGSLVKIKDDIKCPAYSWGNITKDDIGIVMNIVDTEYTIDFGKQEWTGLLSELELINELKENEDIIPEVNDIVKVKNGLTDAVYGFGKIKAGMCGIVKSIDDLGTYIIDFGCQKGWYCKIFEIVHAL